MIKRRDAKDAKNVMFRTSDEKPRGPVPGARKSVFVLPREPVSLGALAVKYPVSVEEIDTLHGGESIAIQIRVRTVWCKRVHGSNCREAICAASFGVVWICEESRNVVKHVLCKKETSSVFEAQVIY